MNHYKGKKVICVKFYEKLHLTIERIIIITGSKGGGGKTPVALSVALTLETLNIPTLAADFNFNNPDLLTILHGTNVEERRRNQNFEEKILNTDPYWEISEYLWLTQWNFNTKVGLPSTLDFWGKIKEICTLDFPKKQPKMMVIDTSMNMPLICPPLVEAQNFQSLPTIEIWHLWSPSITLQLGEQERFVRSMSILNRFSKGIEEQMRHIFTPRHYQATSFFGTFSSITKGEFAVTKSVKFKQTNPKPVLFSEMKDVLFANFLPTILNYSLEGNTSIDDVLSDWLYGILQYLKNREYRTNNVIVVPTIIHKIALLVEELTLKPRRTLKSIKKDLGELFEIIYKNFLEERTDDILIYIDSNNL